MGEKGREREKLSLNNDRRSTLHFEPAQNKQSVQRKGESEELTIDTKMIYAQMPVQISGAVTNDVTISAMERENKTAQHQRNHKPVIFDHVNTLNP